MRAEATRNADGAVRTVLRDATTGATIGYALGAALSVPAALPEVDASAGAPASPVLSDATLLLVDEPSVIFVPAGERPPPAVAPPAAPAIRRLVEREPRWLGVAVVVTLAGGPARAAARGARALPGVLEAVAGFTGDGAAREFEAIQLAVDPAVGIEAVFDAFLAAHDPTSEDSVIFVHSDAQRAAALAARSRLQQARGPYGGVRTRISPAAPPPSRCAG